MLTSADVSSTQVCSPSVHHVWMFQTLFLTFNLSADTNRVTMCHRSAVNITTTSLSAINPLKHYGSDPFVWDGFYTTILVYQPADLAAGRWFWSGCDTHGYEHKRTSDENSSDVNTVVHLMQMTKSAGSKSSQPLRHRISSDPIQTWTPGTSSESKTFFSVSSVFLSIWRESTQTRRRWCYTFSIFKLGPSGAAQRATLHVQTSHKHESVKLHDELQRRLLWHDEAFPAAGGTMRQWFSVRIPEQTQHFCML